MKKKYLFLIALVLAMGTQIVSYNLYAKEKTNKDTPGTAIFVMAIPSEVRVESKTIQSKNDEINVDIKYPKIDGLQNKKFERIINNYLKTHSVQSKQNLTKEAKLYNEQAKEMNFPNRRYELIQNFTIKDTVNGYFVLELFEYTYTGGAHGLTSQKYLVLDLVNNKIVMLKDLFDEKGNYIDEINTVIKKQSRTFSGISDKTQFYIDADADLVIVCNVYESNAYAEGILKFNIAKEELSSYKFNV